MSDILKFPHQAESYRRKARALVLQRQYSQAIPLLKKSYDCEPNYNVFEELVHCHLAMRSRKRLKALWQEYFPDREVIFSHPQLIYNYASCVELIFPLERAVLLLYQMRDRCEKNAWEPLDYVQGLIEHLSHFQELDYQLLKANRDDTLVDYLEQFNQQHPFELLTYLKHTYSLDLKRTMPLYQLILRSADISHYIKSDIFHALINASYSEPVDYLWFGEMHQFVPKDTPAYRQQEFFTATTALIEEYCQQYNPHLQLEFQQQLIFHSMVAYPYFDRLFSSPTAWLQTFLADSYFDSSFDYRPSTQERNHFYQIVHEIHDLMSDD